MKIPAIAMLEEALRHIMTLEIDEKERITRLKVILEAAEHIKQSSQDDPLVRLARDAVQKAGVSGVDDPYALNLSIHCGNNMSPLHLCARRGEFDCMIVLIKAGADVNVISQRKRTPLVEAFEFQHITCFAALLACHPTMMLDEYYYEPVCHSTALDYAISQRFSQEMIHILLGFGAKRDEKKLLTYFSTFKRPQASLNVPLAQHHTSIFKL